MAKVLSNRSVDLKEWGKRIQARKEAAKASSRFTFSKSNADSAGAVKISLLTGVFLLIIFVILTGALYVYQVNDIATKGYEIKEIEKQIQDLDRESKKLQIKEVELKSMNNIEKSIEDSDLVTSSEISYVEIKGPVAMK